MSRICFRIVLGVLALELCLVAPAAADVVVLKDGSRVETRGAFEVRGKRIVFTSTQGTLATLRLDEVDLEASQAASLPVTPANTGKNEPPAAKKATVLVLTDRDVANADPANIRAAEAEPKIVMYATSWCGYCRKARQLLGELGVPYEELDIEKNAAARRRRDSLAPSCGVPVIDFAGKTVCGFEEKRIRQLAARLEKKKAQDSE